MNSLVQSSVFSEWLRDLKDNQGKAQILRRISSASLGNFGDWEAVGEGVSEMRIHAGPGYRVYFIRKGTSVYVLLCGGNKNTQSKDIRMAKKMAIDLKGSK
jgi:putative addiction module killer protein